MRYFYTKPDYCDPLYGQVYLCDHPVYDSCTLYLENDIGLAVIIQTFDAETKQTRWTNLPAYLANDLYLRPGFASYFNQHAKKATDGLYPTVTVRQIMWALKMKPLKKERWETVFDHIYI